MDEEITIGIQVGNVSFSFQTDRQGSNVKTVARAIREIVRTQASLFRSLSLEEYGKTSRAPENLPTTPSKRVGKAETSIILRILRETLLPQAYFKTARTTGDVKTELEKQTRAPLTSRKVSQALGVLFEKRVLGRVGAKGNFRYIQQ